MFLTVCRTQAEASFPLQLTGAYRLEGATSADHLAVSCNHNEQFLDHSNP